MMHKKRVWCVTPKDTPEEVARLLEEHSWTLCTGFGLGEYVFLNDSASEDALQEYAFVKRPVDAEASFVQVESITVSWCSVEKLLDLIRRTLNGEFDTDGLFGAVQPRLETGDEHRARDCSLCA